MYLGLGLRRTVGWGLISKLPFHGKPSAFTWTVCELLSDSAGDHGAVGDREHECFSLPRSPCLVQ